MSSAFAVHLFNLILLYFTSLCILRGVESMGESQSLEKKGLQSCYWGSKFAFTWFNEIKIISNICLVIGQWYLKLIISNICWVLPLLIWDHVLPFGYRLQKITFMFNAIVFVVVWRLLVKRVKIASDLWNMILGWAVRLMNKFPGFIRST